MIDTSVMLAGLIAHHEHHDLARPHLASATQVPAIVLAETFSQLRRTFAQSAEVAAGLLAHWAAHRDRILPTLSASVTNVFKRAVELDLGGNVHDALVAQSCIDHGNALVTLDRRQHQLALALGADSTYLLSPR